jgi:hypothetical protein
MAMSQQQRTPRAYVIDVLVAIYIENMGALAAGDEDRIPSHAAECAYRRIYAARDRLLRAPE